MESDKRAVIEKLGRKMGFHRISIGSMEPLTGADAIYEEWLQRGYAASMEYMKREPGNRLLPDRLVKGSRSAILATVSYYSEKPPLKAFHGNVARYAVGLDYHAVFRRKMRELRDAIAGELGCEVRGKPFIDSISFYEQAYADRHGLGFTGKHSLIITPELSGSYCFVGELFTDLELEADGPYEGTCGKCFRCGSACPTGAIVEPGFVDANLCISFLTIENKEGIPENLRSSVGDWVFGCDICQEVCPYNQRPLPTPWKEFEPDSGAGHSLDLLELLTIEDEEAFQARFAATALRRPKRRGLLRNALVVLGNQLNRLSLGDSLLECGADKSLGEVQDAIFQFAMKEKEPMLREHAAWAIWRSDIGAEAILTKLLSHEEDAQNRSVLAERIESLHGAS